MAFVMQIPQVQASWKPRETRSVPDHRVCASPFSAGNALIPCTSLACQIQEQISHQYEFHFKVKVLRYCQERESFSTVENFTCSTSLLVRPLFRSTEKCSSTYVVSRRSATRRVASKCLFMYCYSMLQTCTTQCSCDEYAPGFPLRSVHTVWMGILQTQLIIVWKRRDTEAACAG